MSRVLPFLGPDDDETASSRSQRGADRLAAFSDAVVAIALTLIMLPIVDVAGEPDATVDALLGEDGYRLASAAVTFVIIGSLWSEHHVSFEKAETVTRRLVALNLVWLAAIIFLPVPTALLFAPEAPLTAQNASVGLYAATAAAAGLLMRLTDREIARHCARVGPVVTLPWQRIAVWIYPALLACASILAFSGLGLRAMFVVLLAVPFRWILFFSRQHKQFRAK